jgi:chitodextrinase
MRSQSLDLKALSWTAAFVSAALVGCATQEDEGQLGDGIGSSAGLSGSGGTGSADVAGSASSGGVMARAGASAVGGVGSAGLSGSTAGSGGLAPGVAGAAGSTMSGGGSAGAASGGTGAGGAGAGGMATAGTGMVEPEPDTTAPSAPSALQATAITASSVTVTWNASSDNVGVTGYRLFNGNTEVTTTTGTIHTFKGLNASTAYSFGVEAYDAADNTSTRAKKSATTSAAAACDAGSAVATLAHGQSYTVGSTACVQLSVNGAWNPVNILLEQTAGGTISYTFNSCTGSGNGTIATVLHMYEGDNPGCNFFVRLSGSGSVTYYD